ncbi:hypothetical protein AGLY_001268 [Aphis glycines]|uniref:Macro domain-containing protein n=1 Tax=Aphis glycines TaxID=307491 RepID=A0A6G0U9B6_APHGL|nr:hypothetical protein AGLY_001268 [Aphis glycines]
MSKTPMIKFQQNILFNKHIKQEYTDENDNQSISQCYPKDSNNATNDIEAQIKVEVDIIDDIKYESICMIENNTVPSKKLCFPQIIICSRTTSSSSNSICLTANATPVKKKGTKLRNAIGALKKITGKSKLGHPTNRGSGADESEAKKQENITKKSHNQGTRLVEINSCILDMPRKFSIGHCAAKDMRMSAGIAIHFKNIYKRVGELMDQRKDVGSVAVLEENQRFIFYLMTKELSNHKPTYDNITAAIKTLHALVVEHGIKKLALPRIGCGLDNLNWTRVRGIIENEFQDGECTITISHFTKHLSKESDVIRVKHPTTIKIDKNIKNIEKQENEKFYIILYSRNTALTVYWDQHFQSVNEKHCFKSQYYEDCQSDLEVGQCLKYNTKEAYIFVIISNKNITDHFSYQNLEKRLVKMKKLIVNDQYHLTFIIHTLRIRSFESLVNQKILSLIRSALLDFTPCVMLEIESSKY